MMCLFLLSLRVCFPQKKSLRLPTGVVLGEEMGVTNIASVTPVLVTGSRPELYLLACPWEDDRLLKIILVPC